MLYTYLSLFIFFNVSFLFYFFSKKMSVIDLFWGPAHFVVVAAAIYFSDQSLVLDSWNGIIFLMVLFWSSRLLIHLFVRSRGEADDRRYIDLSKNWKGSIIVNAYFRVFIIQFVLSSITSLVLYFSMQKMYK